MGASWNRTFSMRETVCLSSSLILVRNTSRRILFTLLSRVRCHLDWYLKLVTEASHNRT